MNPPLLLMIRKTLSFVQSLWLRVFPSVGAVRIVCLELLSTANPRSSLFSCRKNRASATFKSMARISTQPAKQRSEWDKREKTQKRSGQRHMEDDAVHVAQPLARRAKLEIDPENKDSKRKRKKGERL